VVNAGAITGIFVLFHVATVKRANLCDSERHAQTIQWKKQPNNTYWRHQRYEASNKSDSFSISTCAEHCILFCRYAGRIGPALHGISKVGCFGASQRGNNVHAALTAAFSRPHGLRPSGSGFETVAAAFTLDSNLRVLFVP
jgi:hypothetical protein